MVIPGGGSGDTALLQPDQTANPSLVNSYVQALEESGSLDLKRFVVIGAVMAHWIGERKENTGQPVQWANFLP